MLIKIQTIIYSFTLGLLCLTPACGGKGNGSADSAAESNDSLPTPVKKLVQAISDNDSDSFAGLVSYPLQRPYPLHDIDNAEQMRGYYSQLVDDSLHRAITSSRSSNWQESGWRGWSLDDGRYVWVDVALYDVPYVSCRERVLIDSLTREEINSLPESIRQGWKPVLCLRNDADGRIYRIDKRESPSDASAKPFRMAVYDGVAHLHEVPQALLEGDRETEGTAETETYHFADSKGNELVLATDAPDTGNPVLYLPTDSVVSLHRAYWHDLIHK